MMSRKTQSEAALAVVNPIIRPATLELGDETYELVFTFNALAVAEGITGLNLMQAIRSIDNLSATQLRGLLYAALLKRQPEITLDQAGELITFKTLSTVNSAIVDALNKAFPPAAEDPQTPTPQPAAATA